MLKKLLAFVLLSLAGAPAYCAPSFTFEKSPVIITNNSVSSYTILSVQQCPAADVNCAAGWRIFLSSADYQIVSATSTDSQTWGFESGIRLSTTSAVGSIGSMKGFGMYYEPHNSKYQAYFVGVNNTSGATTYTIMRATSTDQRVWGLDSTFAGVLQTTNTYVMTSPRAIRNPSTGEVRLFYVRDSAGSGNTGDYRVYYSTSSGSDYGNAFGYPTLALNTTAYAIDIATLTDNSVRLYMAAPLTNATTVSTIISAVASSFSGSFKLENNGGVILSTTPVAARFTDFSVIRSTENYRWRIFTNLRNGTTYYTQTALTLSPYPTAMSPNTFYRTDTADAVHLYGEVFSSTTSSTIAITNGSALLGLSGLTRNSDEDLSLVVNPNGAALGYYSVVVTNDDGVQATLSNGVFVDYLPGSVTMLDNLFRPLKSGPGSTCKITITVYNSGDLMIRAFAKNGQAVKHIYDGPIPDTNINGEPYTVTWDGTNDAGHTVASGLYFLAITAPKIDTMEKVVVLK